MNFDFRGDITTNLSYKREISDFGFSKFASNPVWRVGCGRSSTILKYFDIENRTNIGFDFIIENLIDVFDFLLREMREGLLM